MRRTMTWVGIAVIFLAVLLGGCEPTDWDLIIDPPDPVTNLAAADTAGARVDLTYDLPKFNSLYDPSNEGFRVQYYVRPNGGATEIYFGSGYHAASEANSTVGPLTVDINMTPALAPGNHVFVVYNTDREYQKSTPAEATVIAWAP